MSLSGPEALRSLEDALRDIRREEDEIAKKLARSAELIAKTRETEGELFRELAQVRLDPATQGEITGLLSQAEVKARDMQKAQSSALSEAEAELARLDKAIADLSAERAAAVKLVADRQAELKALRERVVGEIGAQPDYKTKSTAAGELAKVAAESERKTELAEKDRDEKGKPYRDDPLFMYLWERGYGTPAYKANNLVRFLDGKVARLVDYARARPNFAMLNEIPRRLREHADRQAELAAAARQQVVALEDAAMDAAGGKPAREAVAKAEARIAGIDKTSVETEDQRDQVARRLHELAQGEDPRFAEALSGLAQTLAREDVATLLADARATRTAQDDTIIKQIDAARDRAAEEERATVEQKQRLKTLADRRRELEDIQYEFKKQRYDDPRSTFGEDRLAGDMLNDFLRGAITAASYWNSWQRSQNWRGGTWGGNGAGASSSTGGGFSWPDSSFGGGSGGRRGGGGFPGGLGGSWGRLPGTGGSSSGGGFSRPRSGSAGSRNYGGFKTGGGV